MHLFIPSYHRAGNLKTVQLMVTQMNWNPAEVTVFIDSEADDITEYQAEQKSLGFNLFVFDMEEARRRYDYVHRPSKSRRSAGQARNMFQDYAKRMGIDFYCVQDDDSRSFDVWNNGCWVKKADADKVHSIFMQIESFMRKHRIGVFGLPQGGDFFGGNGRIYLRKVMNCTFYLLPYIYRGERGVQDNDTSMFCGILNEGLFTGSTGDGVGLMQTPSATAMGGLTDLYNENKLLNKALVVPIQFPSAVYAERQYMNGGRLHHHIVYRNLAPAILRIPHAKSNIAWDSYEEDYPFTNEPKRKAEMDIDRCGSKKSEAK